MSVQPETRVFYRSDAPYYGFKDNTTTWCFRKAVLLGSNMFGFPDMPSAYEYRRKVYAGFGMQVRCLALLLVSGRWGWGIGGFQGPPAFLRGSECMIA